MTLDGIPVTVRRITPRSCRLRCRKVLKSHPNTANQRVATLPSNQIGARAFSGTPAVLKILINVGIHPSHTVLQPAGS